MAVTPTNTPMLTLAPITTHSFPSLTPNSSLLLHHQWQHNKSSKCSRRHVIRAARIESKEVVLGSRAPHFELPEPLTGKTWDLDEFESYPGLLFYLSVVLRFYRDGFVGYVHMQSLPLCQTLAKRDSKALNLLHEVPRLFLESHSIRFLYVPQKGLAVVAISSNSVITHPQDGPEYMAEEAKLWKYPFPYLYDESQDVATDFGAVCTPEFFLYKKEGRRPFELVYHGQFDDSRPRSNVPVTGRDLSKAIDCVLSCQPVSSVQKPSVGCSIKWHP